MEVESSWRADNKGDSIKGKMICKKKDGTALNYSFEGKEAS